MSQNENNLKKSDQEQISNLFAAINKAEIEPSPYLRTRVLAHLNERSVQTSQLKFWKIFSASSFVAMAMMGFYLVNTLKGGSADAIS